MDWPHIPVLLEETTEYLSRGFDGGGEGLIVDCTLGFGGHAETLLQRLPKARYLGIDRDPEALTGSAERLAPFGARVQLVEGNFHDLESLAASQGVSSARAILADLGVSSLQLEEARRGFSFRRSGPLDMRMGRQGPTAEDVVNQYAEAELEKIFREYGEERQARKIARVIAEARSRSPLKTTGELRDLIHRAKGGGGHREGRVDRATRVFQALRIEVNRELAGLESFIDQATRLLEQDGRLVIISYHSLEDRIVKHTLRDLDRGEVDPVTGRPRAETRIIEVLTRKPLRPSPQEVDRNPRSRSARMRAARRI